MNRIAETAVTSPPIGEAGPDVTPGIEIRPGSMLHLLGAETSQPSRAKSDHGRELHRAARSIAWQCRKGLYPFAVGGALWGTAATMHESGGNPLYVLGGTAVVAVAGLAIEKARTWVGKKLWRQNWAVGSLALATVWTTTAVQVGAGMDTPMPTVGIIAGGLLAAPWWWLNRAKPGLPAPAPAQLALPTAEPLKAIEAGPHPHKAAWWGHAGAERGALAGSELVNPTPVFDHANTANGTAWTIDGGPAKHTFPAMRQALDEIRATLDRPDVDNLVYLEPDRDGYKTRARLIVLERNPLVQQILWNGPRLNPSTGIIPIAVYPDGSGWASYVLYRPSWGTPHDLIAGCTGSGKSTLLRLLIGESIIAGSVLLLFDPHGGGSFKEALPRVGRSFLDEKEIYAGMRGVAAAHEERLNILREVGEDRMGPEYGHPIIHTVIDEATKRIILGNPDINRIILEGVQEGRKLWMKYTLAMQRPSVDAFDDNSDAREQLLAGNVIIYRVSTQETSRMANTAGLDIEPHALPKSFDQAGEIPTTGLGFVLGTNQRELVSRTINATQEAFTRFVPISQPLDDRTGEAFERGYAEGLADIAMAAESGQKPVGASQGMATVTPIAASSDKRTAVMAMFRERGRLKPKDLVDADVCSLAHAYRLCAELDSEGHVAKSADGAYELKVS